MGVRGSLTICCDVVCVKADSWLLAQSSLRRLQGISGRSVAAAMALSFEESWGLVLDGGRLLRKFL